MVVHHNVKPVLSAEGRMSGERLTMVSLQPSVNMKCICDLSVVLANLTGWRLYISSAKPTYYIAGCVCDIEIDLCHVYFMSTSYHTSSIKGAVLNYL